MKHGRILLLVFGFAFLLSSSCWSGTLNYAVFPAPPFMILDDADGKEIFSGVDVDIVREIAQRMKLDVRFVSCPWARCLSMLKDGQADLLSSAYRKPDRELFLNYFSKPYLASLPIAFYFKKNKNFTIEKYEDLYNYSIGVLGDASYFERFDKDKTLSKFEVATQDQLFPMLMYERFDLIAGYVPTENYRLIAEGYKGKVQRSTYEFSGQDAVYMAISKRSPLINRRDELDRINSDLLKEGFIKKTIDSYLNKYLP